MREIEAPQLTKAQIDSLDGAVVLDPPRFDAAIVGVTCNDAGETVAVYDEEKVIDLFVEDTGSLESAREWYEYNTLRALPYMGARAPVIQEVEGQYDIP